MHDLYLKYLEFDKEKLFQIFLSPQDYTKEALDTAKKVAEQKGWKEDLTILLEQKQKELDQKEIDYENEVAEKAEYYKKLVSVKEQKYSFEIRIADVAKFEGALNDAEIEFFREDKNIGAQIDVYPSQTYYFVAEDAEKVDAIVKELSLITAPYFDYKPFFKLEVIVLVVIVLLVLIAFAILT